MEVGIPARPVSEIAAPCPLDKRGAIRSASFRAPSTVEKLRCCRRPPPTWKWKKNSGFPRFTDSLIWGVNDPCLIRFASFDTAPVGYANAIQSRHSPANPDRSK